MGIARTVTVLTSQSPTPLRRLSRPLFLLCLLGVIALTGCATTPATPTEALAPIKGAVTLPYVRAEGDQFMVDVEVNGEGPFPFIIDTGATATAIYEDLAALLGISDGPGRETLVRGLIQSQTVNMYELDTLSVGDAINAASPNVIVLPKPERSAQAKGIIGMDHLINTALVFDLSTQTVTFVPGKAFTPDSFRGWKEAPIDALPGASALYGLHFGEIGFDEGPAPALIDTGSEITVLNWQAAEQMRSVQAMLAATARKTVVEGVAGQSRPRMALGVEGLKMGQRRWPIHSVLVLTLEPLSVIGAEDGPFIIVGTDLLAQTSFAIDFHRDMIYFRPPEIP